MIRGLRAYVQNKEQVHQYFVVHTNRVLSKVRAAVNNCQHFTPIALFWPDKALHTNKGEKVDHAVVLDLPPAAVWSNAREGAEFTDAYAVLVLYQTTKSIVAYLETPFRADTWTMEQQPSGNVTLVLPPTYEKGVEKKGVLFNV